MNAHAALRAAAEALLDREIPMWDNEQRWKYFGSLVGPHTVLSILDERDALARELETVQNKLDGLLACRTDRQLASLSELNRLDQSFSSKETPS